MIMTTGFKNPKKLSKSVEAIAKQLGLECDISLIKTKHKATESYGFTAKILGKPTICIMADCPNEITHEVIAHEMVHVHQMQRGDLVFDYDNMLFHWKGQIYDAEKLESIEYNERPWEAEAKKLEKELAQNFFMS